MATDHRNSGFKDEQFDRYDTFDGPVADGVDPNREGLWGDFGRLLDQIKIDRAAEKLGKDVSLGEDRVLNDSGNWAAVPHRELYESVHANNDPASAYALAKEWTDLGNMMADNSRVMDEAIRGTETGWQGPGATAARQATLKLATWGGDAAQTSQFMGTRIADQGLAAERAKAAMPEPVEFDYNKMLRDGFATGGLGGLVVAAQDVQVKSAQARSAHVQAAQVMFEMEERSKDVDATTPRFVRPPEVTNASAATPMNQLTARRPLTSQTAAVPALTRQGLLADSVGTSSAGSDMGAFATQSGTLGNGAPGSGAPGSVVPGGVTPGASGVPVNGGVPGGFQPAAASFPGGQNDRQQTFTPQDFPVSDVPGDGSYTGTSAAGYTPPQVPGGSGYQGGTPYSGTNYPNPGQGTNFLPGGLPPGSPSSSQPRNQRQTASEFLPPGTTTGGAPRGGVPNFGRPGMPGMPNGLPGGGPGGGGGGFGPRGGGGGFGGAASESGGLRAPGGSAGAGALAAEEAAMRNQAAGAGRPGGPGQAGSPGMGGGAGAGKGGDEDKEHRNKYATNEKVVDEPGRMVPQVIGEKAAKQVRDDQ